MGVRTASAMALFFALAGSGAVAEPQLQPAGAMTLARAAHQATALPSGQLLISGGCSGRCDRVLASVELYDPAKRSFKPGPAMAQARASHAAIALADGRLLVAGGWTGRAATASAELYDPATGRFSPLAAMTDARIGPLATLLADGRVLISGGEARVGAPLASAEVFDPRSLRFSAVGPMGQARMSHAAARLSDGRVLVAGGHVRRGEVLASAEVFDPASGRFQPSGSMAAVRHKLAAAPLPDGRVMILGGSDARDDRGRYRSTEIFDPTSGRFSPGPNLLGARHKHHDAVLVLPTGALLVAGGGPERPEIYQPRERRFVAVAGAKSPPQMFPTASLLASGEVLILGGYDDDTQCSAAAWLLRLP